MKGNNYLLLSNENKAWIKALNDFITDHKRRHELDAFKEYTMLHYSWKKMATEYKQWFEKIISLNSSHY